ncbi:MAG: sigma-70 family RNA polymerase sigma factor [Scytolyngbya sp. HA4215-MV1]|jgi:hypothetical protein|nr:sigma-70 family RNA polymerase sigma factor [Scytolyngbya sp. HA4215-MV1]
MRALVRPSKLVSLSPEEELLRSLIAEAKQYSPGSLKRQKALTQVIRLVTPKLWKSSTPDYNDALQQTWEYFARNVDRYNPNLASVVTWLNRYLRWRLSDLASARQEIPFSQFGQPADGDLTPFENIPDKTGDATLLLTEVLTWMQTDPTGELRALHIQDHPEVTAQLLLLKRLPPQTSWKKLSQAYGIPIPTLSSFYRRHCFPRLRNFKDFVSI